YRARMLVTTTAYKERVARVIMGESLDITPYAFKLGTGRYDAGTGVLTHPDEGDADLAAPTLTNTLAGVTRYGHTIVATISVTGGGSPATYTEAGLFTQDGLCIALDSFRPHTITPSVTYEIRYTILPGA